MPELGPAIELKTPSFARSLYHHLADDSAVDAFLKVSRFYSLPERRWKLPRNHTKLIDTNFYTPFCNIISSVVRRFWGDASRQRSREVVDTHAAELRHSEEDPSTHTSSPSIVIKAKGSSFQDARGQNGRPPAKIGFSNITTCIEVQVNGDEPPVSEQVARAAICARQMFIHQPNRRFVRLLAITGHHLRLFHFDRAGVQYTPPLDFNEDPHTFVRLIVGLSSPDEAEIGLDSTIKWEVKNGAKISGTITTRAVDNTERVYPLQSVDPFFSRSQLHGRGTTCWVVSDPATGETLLVKDAWKSDDRTSEHVHLQEASGLPGVAQMISCEPDRGQIKHLRSVDQDESITFKNRIETRVVMKCYNHSVVCFTTARQLLCALRDAIAGHRNLFKKGILHRDVSIHNILLGIPGAKPGERGILIDLDMATRCDEDGVHPPLDWRVNAPIFQSILLLYSTDLEPPLQPIPHDHLDDLESFFYVFTYIVHSFDSQGVSYPLTSRMKEWKEGTGENAGACKAFYIMKKTFLPMDIISRWPKALIDTYNAFGAFLYPLSQDKFSSHYMEPEEVPDLLRDISSRVDQHYDGILRIFDEGIEKMEKMEKALSADPGHSSIQPPSQRSSLKRAREDEANFEPAPKRSNSSS
ncbi:hypothetical protein MD484_g5413, partial [Candolleomyces efflorescens]